MDELGKILETKLDIETELDDETELDIETMEEATDDAAASL